MGISNVKIYIHIANNDIYFLFLYHMPLIEFTDKGLYCPQGKFYIDPWRPVDKAIITHAHSDHAKAGSAHYFCHTLTKPLLLSRLGPHTIQDSAWGVPHHINGVQVSLHPSGHIIGAAQIRVEYKGEIWVCSGDYKTENDGISGAFEPINCHTFITESTFGLPIYNWLPQHSIYESMRQWVLKNIAQQKNAILLAYSLGKAQRVLEALAPLDIPIWVHGAIWNMHESLSNAGVALPLVQRITPEHTKSNFKNAIILAPPGADGSSWIKKFTPYQLAVCSGWMQVRANQRRNNADIGFALSDHADWNGLLQAIKATSAEKIFVTHGFQAVFSKYLKDQGLEAEEVVTAYGQEEEASKTISE